MAGSRYDFVLPLWIFFGLASPVAGLLLSLAPLAPTAIDLWRRLTGLPFALCAFVILFFFIGLCDTCDLRPKSAKAFIDLLYAYSPTCPLFVFFNCGPFLPAPATSTL